MGNDKEGNSARLERTPLTDEEKIKIACHWALKRFPFSGNYSNEDLRQEAAIRAWKVIRNGGKLEHAAMAAYHGIQDYFRTHGNKDRYGNDRIKPLSLEYFQTESEESSDYEFVAGDFSIDSVVDKLFQSDFLQCLPPRNRKILLMAYVYGFTHREIAQHFGISEPRIQQIATESKRKIRSIFTEEGEQIEFVEEGERYFSSDELRILKQISG